MTTRRPRSRRKERRELAVSNYARYDDGRTARTGVPEVVLGEGKSISHLVGLLRGLHRHGRGVVVSRLTRPQRQRLGREALAGLPLHFFKGGTVARLAGPIEVGHPSGTVALITAGTADVPIAEEARGVLTALGVPTRTAYDVGVAGLHRLERALSRIDRISPAIYLVFAGREGALPTVVAGLVRSPVVGIPTSVGYGRGGRGEAALSAMLQSCAPLTVVNIDAGVPAALFAAQLVLRQERSR